MLSYNDFEKHINTIKHYYDFDDKITEIFDVDGIVCYSSKAIDSIVNLLEVIMDDGTDNWIQYWMWELNFGVDDNNSVSIDNKNIPLTTIKDLYSMLLKGSRVDGRND